MWYTEYVASVPVDFLNNAKTSKDIVSPLKNVK